MNLTRVRELTSEFEAISIAILARVETSHVRVVALNYSYDKLAGLSLKQDELFRQALRCIEHGLFRAAHVMAWAAFVDFVHEKLTEDGATKIGATRPKWGISRAEDLREWADYQVLEALIPVGLCRRTEVKALHGLLNRRNECAHPEDYHPGLNEALGYVSELLQRLAQLRARSL